MDSPSALDRDGEWYLRGWRDALEGIAAMAAAKDTATSAHHALEAIREHCDVMLAKADCALPVGDDIFTAEAQVLGAYVTAAQGYLFGGNDG